jgi:hypothetical protein
MNAVSPPPDAEPVEYDPLFLNSRREALIIFALWVCGLLWAVPFCYLTGYVGSVDPESMSTIWGIPTWLFWGIFVPWLVADAFTTWFCFCYMKDDDLGEAHEGADLAEEIAEMHAADSEQKGAGA